MENKKIAVLFPGQGAFYAGALAQARMSYTQVDEVLAEIDAAAKPFVNTPVSSILLRPEPAEMTELMQGAPELLQLAIYGISVAANRTLEAHGLRPSLLMGHSFGEIAALVASGAFSIRQGAEIVVQRTAAVRSTAGTGYMAALGTGRARAEKLLELVGASQTAIASVNHEEQCVISGATDEMNRCQEVAKALTIPFVRLNSPFPFHSPLMAPVAEDFRSRIQHIRSAALRIPVFSPILGRYYNDADALGDCLAKHLVCPVDFAGAVRHVYGEGVRRFVECGALETLSKLTAKALANQDITTIPTLKTAKDESTTLREAIAEVNGTSPLAMPETVDARLLLMPGNSKEEIDTFWAARGRGILAYVHSEFTAFKATAGKALVGETSRSKPSAGKPSIARDTLFRDLAQIYANALEYPAEVFTEQVELEAELGIDSVKQTELLARVAEQYHLPERPADFRLSDYRNMAQITDFVYSMLPAQAAPAVSVPLPTIAPGRQGLTRDALSKQLIATYAAALEYPEEVFTDEVQLEAELGIDSVKQTELLARAAEQYHLPPRPADFQLSRYDTLGKVTDFVYSMMESAPALTDVKPAAARKGSKGTNGLAAAYGAQIAALSPQANQRAYV